MYNITHIFYFQLPQQTWQNYGRVLISLLFHSSGLIKYQSTGLLWIFNLHKLCLGLNKTMTTSCLLFVKCTSQCLLARGAPFIYFVGFIIYRKLSVLKVILNLRIASAGATYHHAWCSLPTCFISRIAIKSSLLFTIWFCVCVCVCESLLRFHHCIFLNHNTI